MSMSMSMGSTTMGGMMMSSTMTGMGSMATGDMMSSMPMTMDSAGDMVMDMSSMAMTFFASSTTPLFSMAWVPSGAGPYAGTCIFLIVFAVIFRFLLALRCNISEVTAAYQRRHDTDILREPASACKGKVQRRTPWKVNDALLWALLDTAIAAVSYLLMIAVMTMNIGYFLSILGGTFLGSFVIGRYAGPSH